MARPPLFVAAVRQHVGKTTVSLALMHGMKKRFKNVGFIKPVGQQHIPVEQDGTTSWYRLKPGNYYNAEDSPDGVWVMRTSTIAQLAIRAQ